MIDPTLRLVASDLATVAAGVDTQVLLVGAYARDLCLGSTNGSTRATNDADFAVILKSWDRVDAFFSACLGPFRDVDRAELKMYHRDSGLKVDLIPCGEIEAPPGTLVLRGSVRTLNVVGLLECFDHGVCLDPQISEVLVPPPAGFLILKLLAFIDRRERRDLRDFGWVLGGFPVDGDRIWTDERLMEAFADSTLTYDDVPHWLAGRDMVAKFAPDTVTRFVAALDSLLQERAELRSLVVDHMAGLVADERVDRADRALRVLREACSAPPG